MYTSTYRVVEHHCEFSCKYMIQSYHIALRPPIPEIEAERRYNIRVPTYHTKQQHS